MGLMGTRPKPTAPRRTGAKIASLVLAVLLGGYVVQYLSLGRYDEFVNAPTGRVARVTRQYRAKWVADAFYPLGVVEGWCRGIDVYLGHS